MSKVLDKNTEDIFKELDTLLVDDTPYDPNVWVSDQIEKQGLSPKGTITTYALKKKFKDICSITRNELEKIYDSEPSTTKSKEQDEQKKREIEFVDLQHRAVIGDEQAVGYFINKIKQVLSNKNITSTEYPNFYSTLEEAIFHEVWGISILHKWENYPKSEAAVIRGTELWIDIDGQFIRQPERFENNTAVERVKKAFTMRSKDVVINEQTPEAEMEREDGSRITMLQSPRSRENYIMFRRFIVKDISLYEQANLSTIKEEDIDIFKALSRTMPNTIIAGRVRSAKSTFMKSLLRERDSKYVVASMEKHFELGLSAQLPDRLCFEIQAKEGDLHQAVPRLLRMEHDYIVVGEIRSLETEGYLMACERGERGAASTYHLTDVESIVPQITRHLLDEFPNRNFENELERVARNIDIIITMSTERDRRKKRVVGVTEIIWDPDERKYSTNDLIRYSNVTQKYYYASNITNRLVHLMAEENLEETKNLVRLLKMREKTSPMSDYQQIADDLLKDILGDF
ncbi:Flp pilus assembly complex ATPase component TadA (plasmid) [Alkalihalobacillus hwajinpoensis]|uniref:ATPase, T2SS/T4P/T4SS family n=1 Tax=Guptibacillus hwajinpoensis TaxID=208199 RepID=UPI001883DAE4|nr:ATPase, T2SS/T4P/T4SS family [Pseudalkalibacillus hwajinpoensis]MBF0706737.1 Flp pilus assembly complex ATPase component TadA [Pseudalkalibacillus hwajinpoensis]